MGSNIKPIYLPKCPQMYLGYPHATIASGFCFISGMVPLREDGAILTHSNELTMDKPPAEPSSVNTDVLSEPVRSQSWWGYSSIEAILHSLDGDLRDVLRTHQYQKNKRYYSIHENVRKIKTGKTPPPSSGIGVIDTSPDGQAWITIDGIAIDPKNWKFNSRRKIIRNPSIIKSTSHYSRAVSAGPYIFTSGHIPIDTTKPDSPLVRGFEDVPEEGRFLQVGRSHSDTVNGPIAAQTWFVYNTIKNILEDSKSSLDDVVSITVYLQDMNDYVTFHQVHTSFFSNCSPALSVTQFDEVGHKGTLIEIELTAMQNKDGLVRNDITKVENLTPDAGHTSLATAAGPLIFLSLLTGHDGSGHTVSEVTQLPKKIRPMAEALIRTNGKKGATIQLLQIFENLGKILRAAGSSLQSVAKIILYITDFDDFTAFHSVCNHYIPGPKPALSCIKIPAVSPIPGSTVSIEVIAVNEK